MAYDTKRSPLAGRTTANEVNALKVGDWIELNCNVHSIYGADPETWGEPCQIAQITYRGVTADCHPDGPGRPFISAGWRRPDDPPGSMTCGTLGTGDRSWRPAPTRIACFSPHGHRTGVYTEAEMREVNAESLDVLEALDRLVSGASSEERIGGGAAAETVMRLWRFGGRRYRVVVAETDGPMGLKATDYDCLGKMAAAGWRPESYTPANHNPVYPEMCRVPVFADLIGPMFGGIDYDGRFIVRYESQPAYNRLSR